jgi:hypothetical protein
MQYAVFVKDGYGQYYRRSIWYSDNRLACAKECLAQYEEIASDIPFPIDPILCSDEDEV